MLHTYRGELNQLYDTFCRVWAAGGQATLTTTSSEGKVTAKLELELGQPTGARPGAPPRHLRTASQHQAPASGAARRPCHRGPAAKAKSRARAAAFQAAKAAASAASGSAAHQSDSESTPASPAPGGAPSTRPLNILPSPPASDGQRLVVSVGRSERLPSFSQLDGQDSAIVSPLSDGPSPSGEVEEDIPDVEEVERMQKVLEETNKCIFCGYEAPVAWVHPSKGDNLSGNDIWDHVWANHPIESEWFA